MPKGSKVEKVYRALRDEGMSKERAAKIAQAQTGQALATGKPPKHENSNPEVIQKIKDFFQKNPNPPDFKIHELASSLGMSPDELETAIYSVLSQYMGNKNEKPSPFLNGVGKAIQNIKNKLKNTCFEKQ